MMHYETVLASDAKGKAVENLQQIARIGKAKCLVDQGRSNDAVKMLQQVIDQAPADANLILAMAYNALGRSVSEIKAAEGSALRLSCTSTCCTTRCPISTPRPCTISRACGIR